MQPPFAANAFINLFFGAWHTGELPARADEGGRRSQVGFGISLRTVIFRKRTRPGVAVT